MKKSRKILASALLASVMALSLALSASADSNKAEAIENDDEEIVVDIKYVKNDEETLKRWRSTAQTSVVKVIEDTGGTGELAASIEPRAYSWYSYTEGAEPEWTSGGEGGQIPILARVYERKLELPGGAAQRFCGIEAKIDYDSLQTRGNLKTTITIDGKLYKKNYSNSTQIHASNNTDLLYAEKQYSSSSDSSNCYIFCEVTVTTNSSAFGTSTQEFGAQIVPYES